MARLAQARVAQIKRLLGLEVECVFVAGDGGPSRPHVPPFIALTPFVLLFVAARK